MKKSIKFDLFGEKLLSEKKIKKIRNKTPEITNISKKFLEEYYIIRYTEFFGIPPKIDWGKDIALLNKILKTYTDVSIFGCDSQLDFLINSCEKFFLRRDNFVLKGAWSIGTFYIKIDNIVLTLKQGEKEIIDPIIEGYKIAYFNHTGNKAEASFVINKEDIFAQIYLFLKPLWIQYGELFPLKRFSEIYFLIIFDHLKDKEVSLSFFISKFSQDIFINWLETEGKENLRFFPKDIGQMDKNKLDLEQSLMLEEEKKLYYNIK